MTLSQVLDLNVKAETKQKGKNGKKFTENKTRRENNILQKYMMPVTAKALRLLESESEPDNFLQAAELNKRIINLISEIRKKAGL